MCYLRKGYLFQRHLCKNTDELTQEENIDKFSVPQVYLGPCQLTMIDFFAKMVKAFGRILFLKKTFPSHQMFNRVVNTHLPPLSNSFILHLTSIMTYQFLMGTRSR